MKKAGIIGSGIGGLALALRWRKKGYEVTVFEANEHLGGKLAEMKEKGYRWDLGPSLFTQPWLITELFELFNKNPEDYFQYQQLETICNYFWDDKTRLSTFKNLEKTSQEFESILGENPRDLISYFKVIDENYSIISPLFIESPLNQWNTWLSSKAIKGYLNLRKLGIFSTMNSFNRTRFKNPKTIQLFNRYATYNGSNPYKTPGTLTVIPHLEYNQGAFFPKGGIISIIQSLVKLAKEVGIEFKTNEKIEKIVFEGNKAKSLISQKGKYDFDIIASNSDIRPTYEGLITQNFYPEKLIKQEKSSSGIIFYWGIKKSFSELDVHNIFFANNYQNEFKAIFEDKTMADDITIYLHISSKIEKEDAPKGCENWFLLVNAPTNQGQNWDDLIEKTRKNILKRISLVLGENIEDLIETQDYLDPRRIEARTSSSGGSLYGNASNNRFAAFLRHPNVRTDMKNLYWVGGSVHPGGGIPMCLNSAKIVDKIS